MKVRYFIFSLVLILLCIKFSFAETCSCGTFEPDYSNNGAGQGNHYPSTSANGIGVCNAAGACSSSTGISVMRSTRIPYSGYSYQFWSSCQEVAGYLGGASNAYLSGVSFNGWPWTWGGNCVWKDTSMTQLVESSMYSQVPPITGYYVNGCPYNYYPCIQYLNPQTYGNGNQQTYGYCQDGKCIGIPSNSASTTEGNKCNELGTTNYLGVTTYKRVDSVNYDGFQCTKNGQNSHPAVMGNGYNSYSFYDSCYDLFNYQNKWSTRVTWCDFCGLGISEVDAYGICAFKSDYSRTPDNVGCFDTVSYGGGYGSPLVAGCPVDGQECYRSVGGPGSFTWGTCSNGKCVLSEDLCVGNKVSSCSGLSQPQCEGSYKSWTNKEDPASQCVWSGSSCAPDYFVTGYTCIEPIVDTCMSLGGGECSSSQDCITKKGNPGTCQQWSCVNNQCQKSNTPKYQPDNSNNCNSNGGNACAGHACDGNGNCAIYKMGEISGTTWPSGYREFALTNNYNTCSGFGNANNVLWSNVVSMTLNDQGPCCGRPTCSGTMTHSGVNYNYACTSQTCSGFGSANGLTTAPAGDIACSSGHCCYSVSNSNPWDPNTGGPWPGGYPGWPGGWDPGSPQSGCNDGDIQTVDCGVGACKGTGTIVCLAGSWLPAVGCSGKKPSTEICGNGIDENCDGKADDNCPANCGNRICEPMETNSSCAVDCPSNPTCNNNGICEAGETVATCPHDCQITPTCNFDGTCDASETFLNCPHDCPVTPTCNNDGICAFPENTTNCIHDCPPVVSTCGTDNNIVDGNEQCDGTNLSQKTCATLGLGFTDGTLTCNTDCTFNTSQCTGNIPVAIWADLNLQEISLANAEVQVYLTAKNVPTGNVNFTIFNWTGSGWQKVDSLVNDSSVAGTAYVVWTVEAGKFKFFVNLSEGSIIYSGNLSVSAQVNPIMPLELELSPNCGSNFYVGDTADITLKTSASDDNLITANISFGDGNSQVISLNSETQTVQHQYLTAGTMQIVVTANDSKSRQTKITNIIIIDKTLSRDYIAGCIDAPESGSIFDASIVNFRANSTRAISFEATSQRITELNLNTKVRFKWEFSDLGDNRERINFCSNKFTINRTIDGSSYSIQNDNVRGYNFTKTFPAVGYNWAKLTVEIVDSC